MSMRKWMMALLSVMAALFFVACGGGGGSSDGSGSVSLYMTDAPLLDENVTAVYVTIDSIEYKRTGGWQEFEDFSGPRTVNLLELQDGKRIKLLDATLPDGAYKLRFRLDASQCRIEIDNDDNETLFVPSGKIDVKGSVIISDGHVEATVDFDLHKSVLRTGFGYLLKPFLRVAHDSLSGSIEGNITNIGDFDPALERVVVYIYERGDFRPEETIPDENGSLFTEAVSSAKVDMDTGAFTLSYLPAGRYDLVVARYIDYDFAEVLGMKCNVSVHHGINEVSIDTTDMEESCEIGQCEEMRDVRGIFVHVRAIRYHHSGAGWITAQDFNGSATFDLLQLRTDEGMRLAGVTLPAGHYTQIRLLLDSVANNQGHQYNEGSYVLYEDNTTENLFVPSGAQSGYKLTGDFDLAHDANVTLKADFDLCHVLHETGNGKMMLKPTVHLDDMAALGAIEGEILDIGDFNATSDALVVFAYEEGTYETDETTPVPDENGTRFNNAVAKADVDMANGAFAFANLGEGLYDLAVAKYVDGNYSEMLGLQENIVVEKAEVTTVDINTSTLAQP